MDMEKEYGTIGEAMYRSWENQYEMLAKDVKFGKVNAEEAYKELKEKIGQEIDSCLAKRDKWNKYGWISVAIVVVIYLLVGIISSMNPSGNLSYLLLSAFIPVVCFKMKGSCKKRILAAADCDEKYFDGEIIYRRKNG